MYQALGSTINFATYFEEDDEQVDLTISAVIKITDALYV
jgi:hypothetical protein